MTLVFPPAATALLPPAEVECCYRKDFDGARCRRFELTAEKCDRSIANWNETYRRIQAVNNPPAKPATNAEPGKALPVTLHREEAPASSAPTDGTARQAADPAIVAAPERTFRGRYFEVRYPADFVAHPLLAAKPADADAATFTAPGGQMQFYVY